MNFNKEDIEKLLSICKNKKEIIEKLGYNYNGGTKRDFRKRCFELGIDMRSFDNKMTEEKYNLNPKYCLCCGKKIPYKKRVNSFCSSSCSTKFNNSRRVKKIKTEDVKNNTITKLPKHCENCGNELSGNQERFCSHKCHLEFDHKKYIERWLNGEENGMKGEYGLSSHIKRYLLEKHNYCCEKCNWGEVNEHTHTIPLEIHHIDGDYTNNKEENLQVLCPNCHSLTETYKAHNKKGRTGREKYYL